MKRFISWDDVIEQRQCTNDILRDACARLKIVAYTGEGIPVYNVYRYGLIEVDDIDVEEMKNRQNHFLKAVYDEMKNKDSAAAIQFGKKYDSNSNKKIIEQMFTLYEKPVDNEDYIRNVYICASVQNSLIGEKHYKFLVLPYSIQDAFEFAFSRIDTFDKTLRTLFFEKKAVTKLFLVKKKEAYAITVKDAAIILDKSERTIKYWDKGKEPDYPYNSYPGRKDKIEFLKYVQRIVDIADAGHKDYVSKNALEKYILGEPISESDRIKKAPSGKKRIVSYNALKDQGWDYSDDDFQK